MISESKRKRAARRDDRGDHRELVDERNGGKVFVFRRLYEKSGTIAAGKNGPVLALSDLEDNG